MMTQQEYLDCGGTHCLKCGSEDITAHGFECDSAYGWQTAECDSCEHVWRDLYTLTGFEGVE